MKKIIVCLSLMFVLALLFVAPTWAQTINVVTTTTDLKSIVEFIGGDKVKVYSLGRGNQNPHYVQAKPSYMVKAKKADLFVRSGFELEVGYEPLILQGSRNPNIQVGRPGHLDASTGIHALDVPDHVDRSMGHIHASGNPHYWLDPLKMKIAAKNVSARLSSLYPEHQTYFERNLMEFDRKIDDKMREWNLILVPFKGERLITYHESWSYFAERFGFEIVAELEPQPGVPPSPSHLKEVINVVTNESVKIILMENFYNRDAARFVAEKTGIKAVTVPLSVDGDKAASNYFQLIDLIVNQVAQGFKNG